jgi:ribose/xylose/arabinose/galactoside ABC-type transport system permease subunit
VSIRESVLSYGFVIVMALVVVGYSLAAPSFLTVTNIMALLHAAAPLAVTACGLALVMLSGKLDVSIGSVAYLSTAIGIVLVVRHHWPLGWSLMATAACGAALGAVNGFIVTVLRVNPLITTLGMMFIARSFALHITNAQMIGVPEPLRAFGRARIGPLFVEALIALGVLLVMHVMHTRTPFGRHITAVGNGEDVAMRMGIRVRRVTFLTFLLSGLMASLGGIMSISQVGSVSSFAGSGLEFTAVAVLVIGGVSLFGGQGTIVPGVIFGVLTLAVIENGLNHVGAHPFAYRFVNGGIIFLAMYADSLKSLARGRARRT